MAEFGADIIAAQATARQMVKDLHASRTPVEYDGGGKRPDGQTWVQATGRTGSGPQQNV